MQSGLERFKNRKQHSSVVEVKFLPPTLYRNYLENDLNDEARSILEMTDAEKAAAEGKYHELTFFFRRVSPTNLQLWTLKQGVNPFEESYFQYAKKQLVELFERAEHSPKEGEPMTFTKEGFAELCDYLLPAEMVGLVNDYHEALGEDAKTVEKAVVEGNGLMPEQALVAQ